MKKLLRKILGLDKMEDRISGKIKASEDRILKAFLDNEAYTSSLILFLREKEPGTLPPRSIQSKLMRLNINPRDLY